MITTETAEALASIQYRNTAFNRRVLYAAFHNLRDSQVFFAGINTLEQAGIPPSHVRAYMLIGFRQKRNLGPYLVSLQADGGARHRTLPNGLPPTWPKASSGFEMLSTLGQPRSLSFHPWNEYRRQTKSDESVAAWHRLYAE